VADDPYFFNYTIEPLAEERAAQMDLIRWQAPSVAALGWIPLRTAEDQLPADYRSTFRERLALRLLLQSGNSMPPPSFAGRADLMEFLTGKDFRAALAIDEPTLYCEPDGTPRRFTCWRGHRVGFTPIPNQFGTWFDPMPGDCDECFTVTKAGNQITVNNWMGFKLGKLADWVGVPMTGHRAPSAIIQVQLVMRSTGDAYVSCRSL
jgi:hypothetical protein